ncbi:MAG: hypothetical protein JW866_03110 [Ignavibacteriales bacterium]|nr:hypothetical protein [Ignavibacteriales bacterium]
MANLEDRLKEKAMRLVWGSPANLPVTYANHLQVTHAGGNEFHIFFGYAAPPLTAGLTEDEIEAMPEKITITPLTNIVVTPDIMKTIVDVFNRNLENYEKLQGMKND